MLVSLFGIRFFLFLRKSETHLGAFATCAVFATHKMRTAQMPPRSESQFPLGYGLVNLDDLIGSTDHLVAIFYR